MAYRPCHTRTSLTFVITFGQNTPIKLRTTSRSPPSLNFKPPLKAQFSIARTNTPHPSTFTAHVFTTNPSNRPSKTPRSLNNFRTNPRLLSRNSLNPFNDNMEKPILRQPVLADNSHQATFWPNERKISVVADPSFLSWTHHSVPCSTSLPV